MMEILSPGESGPCIDTGPGGVGCALENIHSFPRIPANHPRTLLHLENGDNITNSQNALKTID